MSAMSRTKYSFLHQTLFVIKLTRTALVGHIKQIEEIGYAHKILI